MRVKHVTSRDNPIVKQLSELTRSASARRSGGLCLLEGEHLVESYVASGERIAQLVLREGSSLADAVLRGGELSGSAARSSGFIGRADEVVVLAASLFDGLSSLATPSGVLAIAVVPTGASPRLRGFVLVLDAVQDPGNVGTLIRTAAAAGASQIWLSPGSAFAWSTKTLRASQGAHFALEIAENVDLKTALGNFSGQRWATLPRALPGMSEALHLASLFDAKFDADVALIVSNEGAGLSRELYGSVTHGLRIPMVAGVESLNVATAGALALYRIAESRGELH